VFAGLASVAGAAGRSAGLRCLQQSRTGGHRRGDAGDQGGLTLQQRLDNEALGVLEAILAARYRRDRVDFLRDVSLGIDKLRVLLRIAHELGGGCQAILTGAARAPARSVPLHFVPSSAYPLVRGSPG
jgi:hypothetical protein